MTELLFIIVLTLCTGVGGLALGGLLATLLNFLAASFGPVAAQVFSTLAEAVRLARRLAGPEGVVLCAGSLYLIGAVRGQVEAGNL